MKSPARAGLLRARSRTVLAAAAVTVAACFVGVAPAAAATPPITLGPVTADVFANPTNSGPFTATPSTSTQFTQTFPVLNFNPPAGTISCTNALPASVSTRPFTDVVQAADGSCSPIVMQGNGQQAGVGALNAFQAAFTTTFTVAAPGSVTFDFYADDDFILGIGQGPGGAQPTYVSGANQGAPAATPFHQYPVVGASNTGAAALQQTVAVNFPAAGTYPVELDYSECCGFGLALTLHANGSAIPPSVATSKTPDATPVAPGQSDGYTVTISNATSNPVTLTSIVDTLPSGFVYTPGSTSAPIAHDPAVSGSQLTWNGTFSVPANAAFAFHFGVQASSTPGTYFNSVTGAGPGGTLTLATDVAPIDVAQIAGSPLVSSSGLVIGAGVVALGFGSVRLRRRIRRPAR